MNIPKSRAPVDQAERIAYRGCRSCALWDAPAGVCRLDNVAQPNRFWCSKWCWEKNPRVTWLSDFAGLELTQSPLQPDAYTCTDPTCPGGQFPLTRFGLCPACGCPPKTN